MKIKKILLAISLFGIVAIATSQTIIKKYGTATIVDSGSYVVNTSLIIPAGNTTPSGAPSNGYDRKGGALFYDTVGNALWGFNGSTWNAVSGAAYIGTTNRITVSSNVINISASYIGQTSLTTLGTIGTGTWQGTAVGAAYGGTGQTTYTTGDLLYASGSTALSKLAAGTNGYVLTSGGPGTAPAWAASSGGGGTVTSIGITGSDFSISNTPITGSGNIGVALATVNSNVGSGFNTFTVNAKGLITAASNVGYLTNITGYVTAGTNISISGAGTSGSPYVITATASPVSRLNTTGSGTTITSGTLSGKTILLLYVGDDVKNSGWSFATTTITFTDGTVLDAGTPVTIIYN